MMAYQIKASFHLGESEILFWLSNLTVSLFDSG